MNAFYVRSTRKTTSVVVWANDSINAAKITREIGCARKDQTLYISQINGHGNKFPIANNSYSKK